MNPEKRFRHVNAARRTGFIVWETIPNDRREEPWLSKEWCKHVEKLLSVVAPADFVGKERVDWYIVQFNKFFKHRR